jgi:hypothetical protein
LVGWGKGKKLAARTPLCLIRKEDMRCAASRRFWPHIISRCVSPPPNSASRISPFFLLRITLFLWDSYSGDVST